MPARQASGKSCFGDNKVARLALFVLPGTLLGAWLGARTYHALSDRNFHDVVLVLLFISGIGLVWTSLGLH